MIGNRTLIILGNGFDLDLGWKTSFNDFFQAKHNQITKLDKMPFIQNMILGEFWYNLEGFMRQITINEVNNPDKISELSHFWRLLTTRIEEYFVDDSIYKTNSNSCAYEFLRNIGKHSKIISFNYTNPFSVCGIEPREIEYVHNSMASTFAGEDEIKIGIDNTVLTENKFLIASEIGYILKSRANQIGDNLISCWKHYDNIIIYGHSLGITDSDYFKPLFDSIISGNRSIKNLYIVTKDCNSLEIIKENLYSYGVSYANLLCSSNIVPIFTKNGKKHHTFVQILQII